MTNDMLQPPGWAEDTLSQFIQEAHENTFATFSNLKPIFGHLRSIDGAYRKLIGGVLNSPEWFPSFFLLRAHAAFLGGARLSLSAQVCEAYMVLRGCLESALYGLYVAGHPGSAEVWLHRHDSEDSLRSVRQMFRIKNLMEHLESVSSAERKIASALYERTIDYGAHPNERAISSNLERREDDEHVSFELSYLTGDSLQLRFCLQTTAEVGISGLSIIRQIYPERCDDLGLTQEIQDQRDVIRPVDEELLPRWSRTRGP